MHLGGILSKGSFSQWAKSNGLPALHVPTATLSRPRRGPSAKLRRNRHRNRLLFNVNGAFICDCLKHREGGLYEGGCVCLCVCGCHVADACFPCLLAALDLTCVKCRDLNQSASVT